SQSGGSSGRCAALKRVGAPLKWVGAPLKRGCGSEMGGWVGVFKKEFKSPTCVTPTLSLNTPTHPPTHPPVSGFSETGDAEAGRSLWDAIVSSPREWVRGVRGTSATGRKVGHGIQPTPGAGGGSAAGRAEERNGQRGTWGRRTTQRGGFSGAKHDARVREIVRAAPGEDGWEGVPETTCIPSPFSAGFLALGPPGAYGGFPGREDGTRTTPAAAVECAHLSAN
ncbi:hypothetical protein THAOC_08604, partial [Thalassiosira oceanica]